MAQKTLQDVLDAVRAQNTRIGSLLSLLDGLKTALTNANQNTSDTAEMQAAIEEIFTEVNKEAGAIDMALTTDSAGQPARAGNGADGGKLPDVGAPADAPNPDAPPPAPETDEERAAREAANA